MPVITDKHTEILDIVLLGVYLTSVANSYRPVARGYLFKDRATYSKTQVALVAT